MRKCNVCHIVYPLQLFPKSSTLPKGRAYSCKNCIKKRNSLYYEKNKEKVKAKVREYKSNNKQKVSKLNSLYNKKRKKHDRLFYLIVTIRSLISSTFGKKGIVKSKKTEAILGCTIEFFLNHLESQFTKEMSWDNRGSYWHIDHIHPVSRAKSEEELMKLNHYTNLRPLEAKENIRKSNKLPNEL